MKKLFVIVVLALFVSGLGRAGDFGLGIVLGDPTRIEILPRLELHQREIHAGAFHQVFGAAVLEAVFPLVLMDDKHRWLSPS